MCGLRRMAYLRNLYELISAYVGILRMTDFAGVCMCSMKALRFGKEFEGMKQIQASPSLPFCGSHKRPSAKSGCQTRRATWSTEVLYEGRPANKWSSILGHVEYSSCGHITNAYAVAEVPHTIWKMSKVDHEHGPAVQGGPEVRRGAYLTDQSKGLVCWVYPVQPLAAAFCNRSNLTVVIELPKAKALPRPRQNTTC